MICIVMFTHAKPPERIEYAQRTLETLPRLQASEDIWFHLADDGSDQEFRDMMMEKARAVYGEHTSVTNSEGRGYGASYNRSSQLTHKLADILLPLEDDWEVAREFDLDPYAKVLREGHFNCIRMGYLGYTDVLRATFRYHDKKHYLELDPDSPEKHVFAGGPRLETVKFERAVGAWPEGIGAGETELSIIGLPAARQGVAWPMTDIKPHGDLFLHMGATKAETGEVGSQSEMQGVKS